ncbi:hypothetical protein EMIT0324P_170035 [Pseudomonas chlororaphis]
MDRLTEVPAPGALILQRAHLLARLRLAYPALLDNRLLINDLNTNAERTALTKLRDNSKFCGLYQKGLARSIADQIYGFNMTHAHTSAAQAKGFTETALQTPAAPSFSAANAS